LNKTRWFLSLGAGLLAAVLAAGFAFGLHSATKFVVTKIANNNEPKIYIIQDKGLSEEEAKEKEEDLIKNWNLNDDITLERDFASNVFGTRASLWKVSVDVIKHSPVLGFTSGNRAPTSLQYDTTGYLETKFTGGIETYHNAYVDIAVSAGLLGLAVIAVFIILNIIKSFGVLFSKNNIEDPLHYGLTAAYCATHVGFISIFFGVIVFSNISSCLYFWLLFGALARMNELASGREDKLKICLLFEKLFSRNGGKNNENT
jgi:hypothetical protein